MDLILAEPLGPGGVIPPGGRSIPSAPVEVAINTVIVSAAQSPWVAIGKGPGMRVIGTGGIVALGEKLIPGRDLRGPLAVPVLLPEQLCLRGHF